jgi:F-type H+-transporting ATPase subunit b
MKRTRVLQKLVPVVALLAIPAIAFAADTGGGHERGLVPSPTDKALWYEMLWTVVVFGIFFTVLSVVVWPKILKALQAREEKQRGDLAAAAKANADAKAALADYEQKLAEAHAEARKLLDQTRADADQLRAKLKAETEAEMVKLRDQASADIDRARQAALQDLYAHSAELATAVAAKILQRQIDEADTQRLVDQSLEELNQRKAS